MSDQKEGGTFKKSKSSKKDKKRGKSEEHTE